LEPGYVWIEFVCPFRILLGRDVGFIGCDMVALVVEFVLQATNVAVRVAGGVKGGRGACDLCLQRRDLGGMVIDFRAALLDFDKVPAAHYFDVPVGGIGEAPLLDGVHAICALCVFVDSAFLALWCRLLCYNCLLLCCCAAVLLSLAFFLGRDDGGSGGTSNAVLLPGLRQRYLRFVGRGGSSRP
jgi:hypothetical protein